MSSFGVLRDARFTSLNLFWRRHCSAVLFFRYGILYL